MQHADWDDDGWAESGDTRWAAGLRWLQAWWRHTQLELPPGPNVVAANDRPIASNLPADVDLSATCLTEAALHRARTLVAEHHGPGIVDEVRLRRSLLTSQMVAINAFTPLERHHDVLLSWASRAVGHDLTEATVRGMAYEWAPDPARHLRSGSAFDVMLDLEVDGAGHLIAIEVKYAEDLAAGAPALRDDKYPAFTRASGSWRDGAEDVLSAKSTRQLWINALLAESTVRNEPDFVRGWSVVLTCGHDAAAREAATTVAALQTENPAAPVSWSSFEQLLDASTETADLAPWRQAFTARYLDLRPVTEKLKADDPRRQGPAQPDAGAGVSLDESTAMARAIADRVLGDGSVLQQLSESADGLGGRTVTQADLARRRLDVAVEALKQARRDVAPRN